MKIADVTYIGRSRRHSRRGPSGTRYSWPRTTSGNEDPPAAVDSIEDAIYFAESGVFEVEWTAMGRIARLSQSLEGPATGIESMLEEMGYNEKQRLAKRLGLKAGGKEEELEDRLRPEIEKLRDQMEEP